MATSPLQNARLMSEDTVKDLLLKEAYLIVNEQVNFTAGQTRTYNASTILGTAASGYDMKTISAEVFVLDTESGSPTQNFYVDGTTLIATGFKLDGSITMRNLHTATLNAVVRIRVSKKAPT